MLNQSSESKMDLCSVFMELKSLGVKTPKIKKFKSSIPKQVTKSALCFNNKIFGVSISEQEKISVEDYELPKFVAISTSYLMKYVDKEIGLFRKAGSVSRQKDLRVKLERGESIENSEPNDVASLLKQWLRELPEALIPVYLHDLFVRCLHLQIADNKITAILLCCHLLPFDHFCTLKHLLNFLSRIAEQCDKNKMGAHNLAIIMAPNIFVMRNDSMDKSSNGLVQQHTSVIELLINNAHRVGLPCSSPHLAEAEALKCDADIHLSTFLDYSPSKSILDYSPRKKKRSSGVQELFTGLKKLVGQNSLSPNKKKSIQEESNSDTRSALKRKAKADDDHLSSMSPLKKKATASSILHEESSNSTPNNKILKTIPDTNENSRKAHSRHKSFNILRRKEKKRQKSMKANALDLKLNINAPSSAEENLVLSLEVSAENKESFFTPPAISPINFENLFSKSGFMKKSVSDCYLTSDNEKSHNKLFSTKSEDSLPIEGIPSTYCLRSTTIAKRTIKRKSTELVSKTKSFISPSKCGDVNKENCTPHSLDKSNNKSPIVNRFSSSRALNLKDINAVMHNAKYYRSKNSQAFKSSDEIDYLKVPIVAPFQAISCENLNAKNSLVNAIEMSVSNVKDVVDGVQSVSSIQSNEILTSASSLHDQKKVKRANSIRISRSRNNRINKKSNIRNTSAADNKMIHKSNSNSVVGKFSDGKSNENHLLSVSDKKLTKRNVRNGSIVRGRPNTVKTGLPTDVCSRYNCDSTSGNNKKYKDLSSSSSSIDNDLFVKVVKKSVKNDPDLSLIHQIEKLTLSPKEEVFMKESESNVEILSPKTEIFMKEDESGVGISNCKNNIIISLNGNESTTEILSCNSETAVSASIIQTVTVRDFVETDTINEISVTSKIIKLKEPESLKTGDSKSTSKRKRERLCSSSYSKDQQARKKSTKVSRINSCPECVATAKSRKVKTLRAVKSSSPRKSCEKEAKLPVNTNKENQCSEEKIPENRDGEQWFSGRKFLEAEEALQNANTEEHECKRESISMILRNNRGHVRAKASLYEPATRTSCSNTPSSQKRSTSTRNTKSRRSLLLPPPPKFVIPETSPIPSYPLKELTNLSNSEDIFFTPPSVLKTS